MYKCISMVRCSSFFLLVSCLLWNCSMQNLSKSINQAFPNGVQKVYLVNNGFVSMRNDMCEQLEEKIANTKPSRNIKVLYNNNRSNFSIMDVLRKNNRNQILDVETNKSLKQIDTFLPDVIIVIDPIYYPQTDAFNGGSLLPSYISNSSASVEIYNGITKKLINRFEVKDKIKTTNANYLQTESLFAQNIYDILIANKLF
jgi:hypothetical protein